MITKREIQRLKDDVDYYRRQADEARKRERQRIEDENADQKRQREARRREEEKQLHTAASWPEALRKRELLIQWEIRACHLSDDQALVDELQQLLYATDHATKLYQHLLELAERDIREQVAQTIQDQDKDLADAIRANDIGSILEW